jgi:hypothetical protein
VFSSRGIYKNLVTFYELAKRTAGTVYFYPDFEYSMNSKLIGLILHLGLKFCNELYYSITKNIGWEAVARLRVSIGWEAERIYGQCYFKHKNNDLLCYPIIDK